jgi:hypothetical protein
MVARGGSEPTIVDDHSGKVMAEGLNCGEVNRTKMLSIMRGWLK